MDERDGPTAGGLLRRACEKHADRPIATFEGETWTYGEAWERGGRLAVALGNRGIEPGDHVGTMMSNQLEYLAANFACVRGGFVHVPMNDMLTAEEFSYMLSDSGARATIAGGNFTGTLADIEPELPDLELAVAVENGVGEQVPLQSLVAEADGDGTRDVEVGADDMLRLCYTGGTTGRPKGARHTHGTLAMDMMAHVMALEIRDAEEVLVTTPLPHAAGYMHLAALTQGAHLTLTQGFDPEGFLGIVDDEPISWTFLVPTQIYRLLDHEALASTDLSSLETVVYGAAPITAERLTEALDAFGDVFVQIYGQTEMPDIGMVLPKGDHVIGETRIESCGKPAAMVDAGIVDPEREDLDFREAGEPGELVMRSPYVMDGYHGKPEQTAETIVDGWLRTGDVARRDEAGYVYLLDRAKDMIVSGGMNVYTTEVEDALDEHPGVRQVAVIGVPHEDWGEAVHAVIVREGNLTAADLKEFADGKLSAYKKPKSVEFVEEIPTTPYGKVDKKALREPYWEGSDRQIS
ncbi:AMP-binding protein [Salinirubellus sp. GCM10025818]|uniref:AMP-binding protein n=1 Tax=Salinirubellus TaxID=2162630 RepID=UPI0030CAD9F1